MGTKWAIKQIQTLFTTVEGYTTYMNGSSQVYNIILLNG